MSHFEQKKSVGKKVGVMGPGRLRVAVLVLVVVGAVVGQLPTARVSLSEPLLAGPEPTREDEAVLVSALAYTANGGDVITLQNVLSGMAATRKARLATALTSEVGSEGQVQALRHMRLLDELRPVSATRDAVAFVREHSKTHEKALVVGYRGTSEVRLCPRRRPLADDSRCRCRTLCRTCSSL